MNKEEKDYLLFLKSDLSPSSSIDHGIKDQFARNTRKEWISFLFKLGLIHLFSGVVTFLVCPQFGLNPFKASPHLPHIFMSYGMWACGLFCGGVFMGSGALVRLGLLNSRERLMANHKGLWATLILSSSFYGIFMIVGSQFGEEVLNYSIVFAFSWLVGAIAFERLSNLLVNRFLLGPSL